MSGRVAWNPNVFKESTDYVIDSMKEPITIAIQNGVEYSVEQGVDASTRVVTGVVNKTIPSISPTVTSVINTLSEGVKQHTVNTISPQIESCVDTTGDKSKELSHQSIDQSANYSNRSFSLVNSIWNYCTSYFIRQ